MVSISKNTTTQQLSLRNYQSRKVMEDAPSDKNTHSTNLETCEADTDVLRTDQINSNVILAYNGLVLNNDFNDIQEEPETLDETIHAYYDLNDLRNEKNLVPGDYLYVPSGPGLCTIHAYKVNDEGELMRIQYRELAEALATNEEAIEVH